MLQSNMELMNNYKTLALSIKTVQVSYKVVSLDSKLKWNG